MSLIPHKLKLKPDKEKINPRGLIVEMVFTVIAITIFGLFPRVIGIGSIHNGQWVIVPVLSPAFYTYIPYIVALLVARGVLQVVLLTGGRWTAPTRWINVGLTIFRIVLLIFILRGPALVALPPDIVTTLGWGKADPNFVANMGYWIDYAVRLGLSVGLIVASIETISTIVKLIFHSGRKYRDDMSGLLRLDCNRASHWKNGVRKV